MMNAILGIDVGAKKIGLAIGQRATKFAFARPPLLVDRWSVVWPALKKIIAAEQVQEIVIGWPLNQDGSAGPQAQVVDRFMTELKKQVNVPVHRRDERYTSQAVIREQAAARRRLQRGQEDSLVAQLLVENYLAET